MPQGCSGAGLSCMSKSAILKIERAKKHRAEVEELLREKRPFKYVYEGNIHNGARQVGPERDEAVVDELATICGDVVHNLRTAIDHAYHERVNGFCTTEEERRDV